MKLFARRTVMAALGILLCLCLVATAVGESGAGDQPMPLMQGLVYDAQSLAQQLVNRREPDSGVTAAALEAVLAHPDVIRPGDAEGVYDFPQFEVEQTGLVTGAAYLEERALWVVTFCPEGVPMMAACAAVTPQGQVVDVYAGSTWLMQQSWENTLDIPRWMWPVSVRYTFHRLFEPEEMWSCDALPGAGVITEAEAVDAAQKAAGVDPAAGYGIAPQYRLTKQYDPAGSEVWTVQFYQEGEYGPAVVFSLDIHSETGEVLDMRSVGDGLG